MIFIGIDPGVNGGIARYDPSGLIRLDSFRDKTLKEIVDLFNTIFINSEVEEKYIFLERVHAMPSKFRGCSTSWTLAESFSTIKTLLTFYGVPYELVLPEKWQSAMGLAIKKSKKKVDKKKLNRERAQSMFPKIAGIDLDTADALLIAAYAKRVCGRS